MKLQHKSIYEIHNLPEVMNATSLSQLVRNIATHGKNQNVILYDPLSYMGDCWELFAEFFFKFFNGDHCTKGNVKSTFVSDYKPNQGEDKGIDGIGKSTLGGDCFIQCKYKANPTEYLTGPNTPNLSNIAADVMLSGDYPEFQFNQRNIIIFNSCRGPHPNHPVSNAYCLNFNDISKRVDKNLVFWNDFMSVIMDTTEAIK